MSCGLRARSAFSASGVDPAAIAAVGGVELRVAAMRDLAFVDALQKKPSRSLGFMTRGAPQGPAPEPG